MKRTILLAGVLVALAGSPASGQELSYTGSVGYATGSYSLTEPTTSYSFLNGLGLTAPRWSVSVTLPIIIQDGDEVTYIGGTQMPTGSPRSGAGGRPGMGPTSPTATSGAFQAVVGDPVARATFTPYQGFGALRFIDIQAMAKAPVADTSTGVGTGQWDLGAGASVGIGFGQTYLFGDVAVWSPGDLPGLELKEYVALSLGVGRPLSDRWSALASLMYASPVVDGIAAPASVGGGLNYRMGDRMSINVGAGVGLTAASPDLSFHLGWSATP